MSEAPDAPEAATTPAASAAAQTREGDVPRWRTGPLLTRAVSSRPYHRKPGDPLYRPLRIYTGDPGGSPRSGNVTIVKVPWEPLRPGPIGSMFEVDCHDPTANLSYPPVDLDDPALLLTQGISPTPSNPRFHAQMVYAVASLIYAAFQQALGRDPSWGFPDRAAGGRSGDDRDDGRFRLHLRPFVGDLANALYEHERGEIAFGYFQTTAENARARHFAGSYVFTALSHDVIVHEVTHALLAGMRAHFFDRTTLDVEAFHEGFADLVAIFQKFTYRPLVESALRSSGGSLRVQSLLTQVAREFGQTRSTAHDFLRSPIDDDDTGEPLPCYDDPDHDKYSLGSVFTSAVFDAFVTIYERKIARVLRVATGSSRPHPHTEPSADLIEVLAEKAVSLADQMQTMLIRAVDYCPPVDLKLGEFLRAVITADRELVPDDPWGYREAWIDAFARRRIVPRGVTTFSEDALVWSAPHRIRDPVPGLAFGELRFREDPAQPHSEEELRRQATRLAEYIERCADPVALGLQPRPRASAAGSTLEVESIRLARRVGPDGKMLFDLIAEMIQHAASESGELNPSGSTFVLDPTGALRYSISSS